MTTETLACCILAFWALYLTIRVHRLRKALDKALTSSLAAKLEEPYPMSDVSIGDVLSHLRGQEKPKAHS